jgi:hypothetical protein
MKDENGVIHKFAELEEYEGSDEDDDDDDDEQYMYINNSHKVCRHNGQQGNTKKDLIFNNACPNFRVGIEN